MLKVPVIPIAIDSGLVWPKRGAKRSGIVTFRFGALIPAGLKRAEAERRVHEAINDLDR
jgi:1-acyl-sn-glycerol-3-phosphate acyltransferase